MDPPECELLATKRATVAFVDSGSDSSGLDMFVESKLFDGVVLTMLQEIVDKTLTSKLHLVLPDSSL